MMDSDNKLAAYSSQELVLASRRAKADLYYSTHVRRQDLLNYEADLTARVRSLRSRLRSSSHDWILDQDYIGSYSLVPKTLKFEPHPDAFRFSDSVRTWEHSVDRSDIAPEAKFRVMSKCSLDFHVISTLWMSRIGAQYEARLHPSAYGGRLRPLLSEQATDLRVGSFPPYLHAYRNWRDRGMKAIRQSVSESRPVVVLTADATSFYHSLAPEFLLDHIFNNDVMGGIKLSAVDANLHRIFIKSLRAWGESVGEALGGGFAGLPVGLPASAVVANLALTELDVLAQEEFKPIHYGRYIDDVILVIDASNNIEGPDDLQDWLVRRSRDLLSKFSSSGGRSGLRYAPAYLHDSKVQFNNSKNKTFLIDGPSGMHLVESIQRNIDERNSEWRALPEMAPDPRAIGSDIASITNADGIPATTIGEISGVTARRAEFAIRLRNFEAYGRDLPPAEWEIQRRAFFRTVATHILNVPNCFDFFPYVGRLIKLAASCNDVESLRIVGDCVCDSVQRIISDCTVTVAKLWDDEDVAGFSVEGDDSKKNLVARQWCLQIKEDVFENLVAGLSPYLSASDIEYFFGAFYTLEKWMGGDSLHLVSIEQLRQLHDVMYRKDLAHLAYRFSVLPPEIFPLGEGVREGVIQSGDYTDLFIPRALRDGINLLFDEVGRRRIETRSGGHASRVPPEALGFIFPTRPLSFLELGLILGENDPTGLGIPNQSISSRILSGLRGSFPRTVFPKKDKIGTTDQHRISIPSPRPRGKIRVSLAMVKTDFGDFIRAAHGKPNNSYARYNKLTAAFNEAMTQEKRGDHLVLGELSFPSRWFLSFASRLSMVGIDLIAGVEYLSDGSGGRHNQVWAALSMPGGLRGLNQFVYRQDKQRPALFEERVLREQAGAELKAKFRWTVPPIIAHGHFHFSILICSELTNISNRAALRGAVDAVIVPEWNQDLHTFQALVESAANDVHAYIIQVNNLAYGDSRIRSPRKKEHERDIVRLHGGTHDYIVTAEIDYLALRDHQSRHRYQDGDFKPVPDGFEISELRSYLNGS